jgi:hypothetical protein
MPKVKKTFREEDEIPERFPGDKLIIISKFSAKKFTIKASVGLGYVTKTFKISERSKSKAEFDAFKEQVQKKYKVLEGKYKPKPKGEQLNGKTSDYQIEKTQRTLEKLNSFYESDVLPAFDGYISE